MVELSSERIFLACKTSYICERQDVLFEQSGKLAKQIPQISAWQKP